MKVITQLEFNQITKTSEQGHFGTVCICNDAQLGSQIVVKKILKSSIGGDLFAEAKKLEACSHPNILAAKWGSHDNDYIYIATPYIPKGSLQSLLNTKGTLTARDAIGYCIDVLTGLQKAHASKVLHLDIKPSNILIGDSNEAILADFGCAAFINPVTGLATSNAIYHPHMPPERRITTSLGIEADIYQVGITLFRLLNGDKWTFSSTLDKLGKLVPQNLDRVNSVHTLEHIPKSLNKCLKKALASNPSKRYRAAQEFSEALAKVGTGLEWQYSEQNATRTWKLENQNKAIISTFTPSPKPNLDTLKTINGGVPRKMSDFCATGITDKELRKLIEKLALQKL